MAEAKHEPGGDGETDSTDFFPDTRADTEVEIAGCSLEQFCSSIDTSAIYGLVECMFSDWQNDNWIARPRDCRPIVGFGQFDCVVRKY